MIESKPAELQTIGETIRSMHNHFMLTQQQLAEMAGISDRTLRDIENGTGTPGIGTVLTVINNLGLRVVVHR